MAALAQPPAITSKSLFEIEETLAALIESADTVTPEQEEEFIEDIAAALEAEAVKCDAYERYLRHCEMQAAFAKAERQRLKEREEKFERALEKAKSYLVRVIRAFGKDAKGKFRRLEGTIIRFRIQGGADSVTIQDEAAIPSRYKNLTIKLPATIWEQILGLVNPEDRAWVLEQVHIAEAAISKTAIKIDLESKIAVPGAKLNEDQFSLRRE